MIAKCLTPSDSTKQTPCYPANSQINVTKVPFYATLEYVTGVRQGTSRRQVDEDTQEVTSIDNVTYSIHIIGKNAILWANRLCVSLRLSDTTDELVQMGIGILNISPIRDLSLAIDGGYEERAQIDMVICQRTTISSPHDSISDVDLTIEAER